MEHVHVPTECYTIQCKADYALSASNAYYERLLRSYQYLVPQVSAAVGYRFDTSKLQADYLFRHGKIKPELFFLHDLLLDAAERDEVEKCRNVLSSLDQFVRRVETTAPGSIVIDALGDSDWESYIVDDLVERAPREWGFETSLTPVPDHVVAVQRVYIEAGLRLVHTVYPEIANEIRHYAHVVKLFNGQGVTANTDVRAFHCMFIRVPGEGIDPVLYYAERLVHETSHMHLNALMAGDPVVLNDWSERFRSPLRPDPRPMMGIYHAMYVTSRIVDFFTRLARSDQRQVTQQFLAETVDELIRAVDEVRTHGKLTEAGRRMLEEAASLLDRTISATDWSNYPLSEEQRTRFGVGVSNVSRLQQIIQAERAQYLVEDHPR